MAGEYAGQFVSQTAAGEIRLELVAGDDGSISGTLSDDVSSYQLTGELSGEAAVGSIQSEGAQPLAFVAGFAAGSGQLELNIYPVDASGNPLPALGQRLVFERHVSAGDDHAAVPAESPADSAARASDVFVNGEALGAEQRVAFERKYQTRLVAGRYWYDRRSGAWGMEGGPTMSFILPSLPLPGPMPENISGGGTGIFINGRELHPADRQALIFMFGAAWPGRYWLDANGNLGFEGGGVLINLAALARQRQATSHSAHGTVSTGPEGAMFSGSNLSTGKPTFWYSGM